MSNDQNDNSLSPEALGMDMDQFVEMMQEKQKEAEENFKSQFPTIHSVLSQEIDLSQEFDQSKLEEDLKTVPEDELVAFARYVLQQEVEAMVAEASGDNPLMS